MTHRIVRNIFALTIATYYFQVCVGNPCYGNIETCVEEGPVEEGKCQYVCGKEIMDVVWLENYRNNPCRPPSNNNTCWELLGCDAKGYVKGKQDWPKSFDLCVMNDPTGAMVELDVAQKNDMVQNCSGANPDLCFTDSCTAKCGLGMDKDMKDQYANDPCFPTNDPQACFKYLQCTEPVETISSTDEARELFINGGKNCPLADHDALVERNAATTATPTEAPTTTATSTEAPTTTATPTTTTLAPTTAVTSTEAPTTTATPTTTTLATTTPVFNPPSKRNSTNATSPSEIKKQKEREERAEMMNAKKQTVVKQNLEVGGVNLDIVERHKDDIQYILSYVLKLKSADMIEITDIYECPGNDKCNARRLLELLQHHMRYLKATKVIIEYNLVLIEGLDDDIDQTGLKSDMGGSEFQADLIKHVATITGIPLSNITVTPEAISVSVVQPKNVVGKSPSAGNMTDYDFLDGDMGALSFNLFHLSLIILGYTICMI